MSSDTKDDRRQAARAAVSTSAVVLARHNNGVTFVIENISTTGARLAGPLTLGVGARIQILFEIDRHPVDVKAEVIRVDKFDMMTDRVAVSFRDVDPETHQHAPRAARAADSRRRARPAERIRRRRSDAGPTSPT